MIIWLRKHKFQTHVFSFVLMVLASIGLYNTIDTEWVTWIWGFLGLFVLSNVAAILVK